MKENHLCKMINTNTIKEEISEFLDDSETNNLSKKIVNDKYISESTLNTECTAPREVFDNCEKNVKLSFSVDRLLKIDNKYIEDQTNDQIRISPIFNSNGTFNNNLMFEKNNPNFGFDCCKNFEHIDVTVKKQSLNREYSNGFTNCDSENKLTNEFNYIVRPTPIRVANNIGSSQTTSNVNLINNYQTVLKFHQLANQFNMINPLTSLKSLQSLDVTFRSANNLQHNMKSYTNPIQINCQTITTPQSLVARSTNTNSTVNNSLQNISTEPGSQLNSKRKRSWSRAVFSNLQRKGLEIQFQQQKYITKPDRRKLANRLNLTDAQVKVWFQNRRMKWRHTQENLKSGQEKQVENFKCNLKKSDDNAMRTSSDDEDEIDVVAE